ncbi:hypothetical protein A7J05_06735 [Streptomyces alfalfae]|uniref:Uncharacterized protein n=1 Tax=Streptomyces alfalfae TaxID=1642299 RepID=A0ABM6GPW6_9ACTN|nr:hypothetical protein A7J05_06735 [Streptomyces alfalfae]
MRDDLRVRPALPDHPGEFEERRHVVADHAQLGAVRVTVDDEQRLRVLGQPEEGLLAAEPALGQPAPGEPAEYGTDADRDQAEDDDAQVSSHGGAW